MSGANTADVFRRTWETLRTAQGGLEDFLGQDINRRLSGFRNLVVFGRSVTNVLQNLRTFEPDFDEWYRPEQAKLRDDALLRYFYLLRSQILKEGLIESISANYTVRLGNVIVNPSGPVPEGVTAIRDEDAPPGANGFFVGDRLGGSGWVVQLPDGSTEHYYLQIPGSQITSTWHLSNAPTEHRGESLHDTSLEALCRLYFDYLAGLVNRAALRFNTPQGT
jgi:hypothetical protein